MSRGLNWDRAKRDSATAKERVEQLSSRRSGQAKGFGNYKPTTDAQRAYIESLQQRTGTSEPVPPAAWMASNLIKHLLKLDLKQHTG